MQDNSNNEKKMLQLANTTWLTFFSYLEAIFAVQHSHESFRFQILNANVVIAHRMKSVHTFIGRVESCSNESCRGTYPAAIAGQNTLNATRVLRMLVTRETYSMRIGNFRHFKLDISKKKRKHSKRHQHQHSSCRK